MHHYDYEHVPTVILLHPMLEVTGFVESSESFMCKGGQRGKRILNLASRPDCN